MKSVVDHVQSNAIEMQRVTYNVEYNFLITMMYHSES